MNLKQYEYYRTEKGVLYCGSVFDVLPLIDHESVNCVVTSPPYWGLRDYGTDGQIGLEQTPEEYVEKMAAVFRDVKRVLRDDGTVWLNLGDSYNGSGGWGGDDTPSALAGSKQTTNNGSKKKIQSKAPNLKPKDLCGIPWRVAFALQADGWYLRQDIIWSKPNPMPESVTDRCTKAHEYIFLLSKSGKYFYNADANREGNQVYIRKASGYKGFGDTHTGNNQKGGFADKTTKTVGRNKRSVWTVSTQPFSEAHFATFPPQLIQPCILAGCPENGTVLDPFFGAGTTGYVCEKYGRKWAGIELNESYAEISKKRIQKETQQLKMFS